MGKKFEYAKKVDPLFHRLAIISSLAVHITGISISFAFYEWLFNSTNKIISDNILLIMIGVTLILTVATVKRFIKATKHMK